MRNTSNGFIYLLVIFWHYPANTAFYGFKSFFFIYFALCYIKLATTASFLGIIISGSSNHPFFMKQLLIELCRNGITYIAVSQRISRFGCFRIRVSSLNHNAINDAVEKGAIVKAFFSKFDKIGFVFRGFIE